MCQPAITRSCYFSLDQEVESDQLSHGPEDGLEQRVVEGILEKMEEEGKMEGSLASLEEEELMVIAVPQLKRRKSIAQVGD